MILYHGTNCDFAEIDISRCSPNKDFGQGFYLTDIPKQAEYMAMCTELAISKLKRI